MYSMHWPDYFDEEAPIIEDKGWFADVLVEWNGQSYRPVFYDPIRLGQTIADELRSRASFFREPNLIVIDQVTRDHMEAAIAVLVEADFNLVPDRDRSEPTD
ncbi:hypothetical protein [Streptosporangium sp. NPDC000396]|uniref:hypothetical protein n=1 Tax=Streptosporangium sp. NPDC000396 TaxID=3366185 RepID=UPI00368D2FA6